jgi:hypothetical protein
MVHGVLSEIPETRSHLPPPSKRNKFSASAFKLRYFSVEQDYEIYPCNNCVFDHHPHTLSRAVRKYHGRGARCSRAHAKPEWRSLKRAFGTGKSVRSRSGAWESVRADRGKNALRHRAMRAPIIVGGRKRHCWFHGDRRDGELPWVQLREIIKLLSDS